MNNSNSSKQVLLSVIGVAILVVAVVGVSFAFFNYTRTGQANTVKTGQIFFEQSQSSIKLTNVFPVTAADAAAVPGNDPEHPVTNDGVGLIDVTIHGYTTYTNGIDFTIKAEDVNVIAQPSGGTGIDVPFSVDVSATGFSDNTKATITTTSYGPNNTGREVLTEGATLASGKIKAGGSTSNNFTGHVYIKAYLDAGKIAISDTYPAGTHYDVKTGLSAEKLATCVSDLSALNATEAFCQGTGTIEHESNNITFQEALDSGVITAAQKTTLVGHGIIEEKYTDGTTSEWVNGRTVLTTEQWNSLSSTPLSFKVRVEANEGA